MPVRHVNSGFIRGPRQASAEETLGGNIEAVATDSDEVGEPDVEHPSHEMQLRLSHEMQVRLHTLGFSILAASKLGILSRSTLTSLRDGDRVPNYQTLSKLDELLSWEPGSAREVLAGGQPIPREQGIYGALPAKNGDDPSGSDGPLGGPFDPGEDPSQWDYENLSRFIESRLRALNMTKSKFAALGGPGRSTLATLGKRGYTPTAETLDRIDMYLMWERGSALTALRGGRPIARGPSVAPHPALVPLNAMRDSVMTMKIRLKRQAQSVAQLQSEVDEAASMINVAISELGDPARHQVLHVPDSGRPNEGDAAGKGEIHD